MLAGTTSPAGSTSSNACISSVTTDIVAGFNGAWQVRMDDSGNLIVIDRSNHQIKKVNMISRTVTHVFGSGVSGPQDGFGTSSQFAEPCDITMDSDGNVLVADLSNHRIRKITLATGQVSTVLSGGLDAPHGITTDAQGNIIWVEWNGFVVRRAARGASSYTTVAGGIPGFL